MNINGGVNEIMKFLESKGIATDNEIKEVILSVCKLVWDNGFDTGYQQED